MNEKLNRRYTIEGDDLNLKLMEKYDGKNGKAYARVLGYFPNLGALKRYVIQHLLRVEGLSALEDIERKLQAILFEAQDEATKKEGE